MTDKKLLISTNSKQDESRVLPILVAGLFCFVVAVFLGYGAWRVFGWQARENGDTARYLSKIGLNQWQKGKTVNNPQVKTEVNKPVEIKKEVLEIPEIPKSETETTPEIEDMVDVDGGEFAIGGGETQRPLQRVFVDGFQIAETEVTNAQYAEFIKETGHRSPIGWNKSDFPKDTENFPVVNVSWDDANAFCQWMSEKYKKNFRLPTQAEWELAASGLQDFKYPWGNDWNDEAVEPKKTDKANPVKSFPINKSPFGAYDMLGNVWEWTSEEISRKEMESEKAKQGTTKNEKVYLVLGGSFIEKRKDLRNTFWAEINAPTRTKSLGFRYVIIPN